MRSTCTFHSACIASIFIGWASDFFFCVITMLKVPYLFAQKGRLLFLLSPIFLYHKIQDCNYMSIINKKLLCTAHHKNTPALPATFHKES